MRRHSRSSGIPRAAASGAADALASRAARSDGADSRSGYDDAAGTQGGEDGFSVRCVRLRRSGVPGERGREYRAAGVWSQALSSVFAEAGGEGGEARFLVTWPELLMVSYFRIVLRNVCALVSRCVTVAPDIGGSFGGTCVRSERRAWWRGWRRLTSSGLRGGAAGTTTFTVFWSSRRGRCAHLIFWRSGGQLISQRICRTTRALLALFWPRGPPWLICTLTMVIWSSGVRRGARPRKRFSIRFGTCWRG